MKRPRGSQIIDPKAFGERARRSFKTLRDAYRERRMPRVTVRTIYWRVWDVDRSVNESTVGRWLAGRSVPESRERIVALARALEIDADWLAGGDEGLSLSDGVATSDVLEKWPETRPPASGRAKRSRARRPASER